jgi:branched-chain amino acid transport system substrate-binding protein
MNARMSLQVFGILILSLGGCGRKASLETVRIGHLAPSAGLDPGAGEHARRGILLAVEEANRDEGAGVGRHVEVLHPECRNDPEAIRAAAVRLVTINKVAALLGGTNPAQVEALARVAESWKLPLVAPGGPGGRTASSLVFHTNVSPAYHGKVLARFAAQELTAKSVAVLIGKHEGREANASALAAGFTREFRKADRTIGGEWGYKNSGELKVLAGRLDHMRPDAVLLAGDPADLAELGQAGLPAKTAVLFGGEEGSLPAVRAEPIHHSVYLATPFAIEDGPPQTNEFVRRYQERFHDLPDVHAALALDSARLLFEGLRRSKELEPAKLPEALVELKTFDSSTGLLYLDKDHWAHRTLYILRVENGQAKTIHTVEPEQDQGGRRNGSSLILHPSSHSSHGASCELHSWRVRSWVGVVDRRTAQGLHRDRFPQSKDRPRSLSRCALGREKALPENGSRPWLNLDFLRRLRSA